MGKKLIYLSLAFLISSFFWFSIVSVIAENNQFLVTVNASCQGNGPGDGICDCDCPCDETCDCECHFAGNCNSNGPNARECNCDCPCDGICDCECLCNDEESDPQECICDCEFPCDETCECECHQNGSSNGNGWNEPRNPFCYNNGKYFCDEFCDRQSPFYMHWALQWRWRWFWPI